jgi:drug/metabolite transporter (DMT)-like permease
VAAAATSWGSQAVAARILLTAGIDASQLVSARTALAFLILVVGLAGLRRDVLRVRLGELARLVMLGVVGMALSQYTYYVALARIPVATTLLIVYTSPLFVLAAIAVFYREPLRRHEILAAALTLAGAMLVIRAYDLRGLRLNALGLAAGLFCAAGFAFYNLWAKTIAGVSPWTMLVYSLGSAAAFWVPLAPPWAFLLEPHSPRIWVGFAVIVIFGTLVPFGLYLAGLARISAAQASVTSTLEPVVAAGVAFLALGEILAWPQLLGGLLVLGGIALLQARA